MSNSSIRQLCKYGAEALKPRFEKNKWCSPPVSKRNAAKIRKNALIEGTFGSFDSETGKGWNPTWDNPGKMPSIRNFKGHKRERTRENRAVKIENNMKDMDQKIAAYRKDTEDRKEQPGLETYLKKLSRSSARKY